VLVETGRGGLGLRETRFARDARDEREDDRKLRAGRREEGRFEIVEELVAVAVVDAGRARKLRDERARPGRIRRGRLQDGERGGRGGGQDDREGEQERDGANELQGEASGPPSGSTGDSVFVHTPSPMRSC